MQVANANTIPSFCTAKPGDFALLAIPVKTSHFIKLLHLAVGCYVMSVNQEHLKHCSNYLILLHE